jgi:hypothetical protein
LTNVLSQIKSVINNEEIKMNDNTRTNRIIDTVAWGVLFIWWGITLLVQLPAGFGLIGMGVIVLGANAVRYFQGIRINGFSAGIGVLALVWGGLELAGAVLTLPFELPVFPVLLIVLGVMVLIGSTRDDAVRGKEA